MSDEQITFNNLSYAEWLTREPGKTIAAQAAEIARLTSERDALRDAPCNCWEKVNALIVNGPLQGNGCDQIAQRNGIILAANAIMQQPNATGEKS